MECKIRDVGIYYESVGEGIPVIMLHGFSPDHRLMSGCMEPIFKKHSGYRRVYLDLPGMGRSQSAEWITNSDHVLDLVLEFIEKIIPGERFLLAGESYGGYLSRGVVHRIPDRVAGLFFLCPAIILPSSKRIVPEHIVLKGDPNLVAELDPVDAKGFAGVQVVHNRRIWERYRDEVLSGIKLADEDFLARLRRGYEFSFDVDHSIREFSAPTLMLMGRQDSSVGYKDAWSILDSYPRATFAVLDRAGHNLQLEQEALMEALLEEWLTRVEEFLKS